MNGYFDSGHVSVIKRGLMGDSSDERERDKALSALRLFESLCLPFRCGRHATYRSEVATRAATALASVQPERAFGVILRARDTDALTRVCSRLFVARLSAHDVERLVALSRRVCKPSCDHSLTTHKFQPDDVQTGQAIELWSRLSMRTVESDRLELLDAAIELVHSKNFEGRLAVAESTLHAIVRVFAALGPAQRVLQVQRLIDLPLIRESTVISATGLWNDPLLLVNLPPLTDDIRPRLEHSLNRLLVNARDPVPEIRLMALYRLVPLCRAGYMTEEQNHRFGEALWDRRDASNLP